MLISQSLDKKIAVLLERRLFFLHSLMQGKDPDGASELISDELEGLGVTVGTFAEGHDENEPAGLRGVLKGSGTGKPLMLIIPPLPFLDEGARNQLPARISPDLQAYLKVLVMLDLLKEAGLRLKSDLMIQSISGEGRHHCRERAVSTATGEILSLDCLHRDIGPGIGFSVTVYGKAAPSCNSERGASAIETAFIFIRRMTEWSSSIYQGSVLNRHFAPEPALRVSSIEGGEWVGAVPVKCAFKAEISAPLPGGEAEIRSGLMECFDTLARESSQRSSRTPVLDFTSPDDENGGIPRKPAIASETKALLGRVLEYCGTENHETKTN